MVSGTKLDVVDAFSRLYFVIFLNWNDTRKKPKKTIEKNKIKIYEKLIFGKIDFVLLRCNSKKNNCRVQKLENLKIHRNSIGTIVLQVSEVQIVV